MALSLDYLQPSNPVLFLWCFFFFFNSRIRVNNIPRSIPIAMEFTLLKLKQQLTCPLCSNTYKKPKILACYHLFCCECFEKHVLSSERDGKFNCPECKTQVDIPDGRRFDDLPTSFYHYRLLNYLAIRQSEEEEELRCSKCDLNEGEEILYCFEYGNFLCRAQSQSSKGIPRQRFRGHGKSKVILHSKVP